ncbi:hypothetical protein C8F01DRAFT_1134066 [Mycena amicta]|nr:hypothetical protein C8F01DRAFT_1134066 [Mycena amicta]
MPLSLELIVNATIPFHKLRQENIHVKSQFRLEWAWGLPAGSLESYLNSFTDPAVEALLKDDKSVLAVHPSLLSALSRQKPDSRGARKLNHIDELYNGQRSFDYVVLHADETPTISPWVISSPIPPHLTMGRSHMKLFLNDLDSYPVEWLDALFKLPTTFSSSDATPRPNALTLMDLYYLYKDWICAFAPPSFIAGLPHPELSEETEESSESEESMYTDESAATYETPPRRLLPHEMARDPNARDDEDDDDGGITDDSHISGADCPEAYSKASWCAPTACRTIAG